MSKTQAKKVCGKSKKQNIKEENLCESSNSNDIQKATDKPNQSDVPVSSQSVETATSTVENNTSASGVHKVTLELGECEISATPESTILFTESSESHKIEDQKQSSVETLNDDVEKFQISSPPPAIVFHEKIDRERSSKWSRIKKSKVPAIFFHKPLIFIDHVKQILSQGIKFYYPKHKPKHIKILCATLEDHKLLVKYFDQNNLPYHTFSRPNNKWVKAVIRGLSDDVNEAKLKSALKAAKIPVKRVNKMHVKESQKGKNFMLAVIPPKPEAKKLFKIKSIFGNLVTVEPPLSKSKQCYRCQKWGHNQRLCRGEVKCVKCAGNHMSHNCSQDKSEPPKCVNCGGEHTASFRFCPYCPDSRAYQHTEKVKKTLAHIDAVNSDPSKTEIVTLENFKKLFNIERKEEEVVTE